MDHQDEQIAALVTKIRNAGFRPFVAKRGTYGFYTNQEGSRVVTFERDLGSIKFSGTYVSEDAKRTGTGWRLDGDDIATLINTPAPSWAHQGVKFRYGTLQDHLDRYQSSSLYTEIV